MAPGPGSPRNRPGRALPLLLALAVLGADQASKAWVISHLAPGRLQPFLPGLLALQRVSNTGAAFSLFQDSVQILGLVSLLVSAGVLLWILLNPPHGIWPSLAPVHKARLCANSATAAAGDALQRVPRRVCKPVEKRQRRSALPADR